MPFAPAKLRTDNVGSLLRPEPLRRAREDFARGAMDALGLEEVRQ